jgi:hypothetical protein
MTTRTQVFRFAVLFALLALVLCSSRWMPTAEATAYTISGWVTDGDAHPIQGVTITATREADMQNHVYLPLVMRGSDQDGTSQTGFGPELQAGAKGEITIPLQKEIPTDKPRLLRSDHGTGAVAVQALTTYTAITDADGNYTLNDLPAGAYILVPSQDGQFFSPSSRTVTVPPDAISQDFEINNPPNIPSSPTPADGALDQGIDVDLSWAGGDPDGDEVTYDVYFEADDSTPDELICDDTTGNVCDPGTLSYNMHYYWQVIATDEHGVTATETGWDFTTGPVPAPELCDSVLYMATDTGYALVDDNASLDLGVGEEDDFTIEAFFFVPDLDYDDTFVDALMRKEDSFSFNISFNRDQPDWILFEITTAGGGEVTLAYPSNLQVGWHHVAAAYDNEYTETEDALAIFLDGVRVSYSPDENIHVDWTPGIPNSFRPLEVGGVEGGRAGFYGYLEEIRISDLIRYNGATYSVPTEPFVSDANTVALWHFDETAGSTVFADASSYGNHLTGYAGAQTYSP